MKQLHDFSSQNSVVQNIVSELRDRSNHKNRQLFKTNIRKIGQLLAYELSKTLSYTQHEVQTPLAKAEVRNYEDKPVVCSVLRAGLPLQEGVCDIFTDADQAFISAYRHHTDTYNFEVKIEYLACPVLEGRLVIVADTMLATGHSVVDTCKQLFKHGIPKELHLISAIGSREGVNYVLEQLPEAQLWIAMIDPDLNEFKYIVPGLGDAGDLAFGDKVQR